ncbi:hypothetical protein QBC46DRAFT_271213, partial [Diplogelasinospora grovesii]
KNSERETADRYHEGKANSHIGTDSKDQRSIASRLAAEERDAWNRQDPPEDKETAMAKKDPTLPAKTHSNEPSRGAKTYAEIQAEEEEMLKKKGANLPGKKN